MACSPVTASPMRSISLRQVQNKRPLCLHPALTPAMACSPVTASPMRSRISSCWSVSCWISRRSSSAVPAGGGGSGGVKVKGNIAPLVRLLLDLPSVLVCGSSRGWGEWRCEAQTNVRPAGPSPAGPPAGPSWRPREQTMRRGSNDAAQVMMRRSSGGAVAKLKPPRPLTSAPVAHLAAPAQCLWPEGPASPP